ncbi:hypothetical protein DSO57_1030445 [Entomophthora muscae]|uniref:Uncharacterized protein n=1 Tax=Entomophthora muscae TaxID=34485 RepID=A0ACC2TBU5_9FUNG|nr:hypothetical protein DSO57_1030445 [Entomophthora muscae]
MYPQAQVYETPILLDVFPEKTQIQHVAAGRSHALALTKEGKLYQFDNSEEKASLVTFDGEQHFISQSACGFNSSVCLTKDQKIFYWRYDTGIKTETYRHLTTPQLKEGELINKVAAGEHFVLGSTNLGRAIKWEVINPPTEEQEVYTPSELLNLSLEDELAGRFLNEAASLNVGHVVAQFRNFGLFDDKGKLWIGKCVPSVHSEELEWSLEPPRKFEDNGNPILCSFGDWHTGVVFDNGHLYTWGEHGLGNGSPAAGSTPEPQRVGYFKDNYFVFYVSCAGWHTAALAVDLSIPAAAEPPEYPEPAFERTIPQRHRFMTPQYDNQDY